MAIELINGIELELQGGTRGLQGIQGEKGDPGNDYTPMIGTVDTLEPGLPATVSTNIDEEQNTVYFNFGIPKGEKGDRGDTNFQNFNIINGELWATDQDGVSMNLGKVAMVAKGNYDNSTSYQTLDTVQYNDSTYMAKTSTLGNLPTDTTYWQLIGGGLTREDIVDNLDSNDATKMLSAKQGNNLNKKKIEVFDTVALMKAANLKNNMTVETLGYYSVNDGGGATYKITNTASVTEYQEELNNGLYATLKFDKEIKIKQLGALSGSSNDITSILNFAINTGLQVINDNLDEEFYITSPIDTKTDIKMKNINLVCNFSSDNYLFTFTNNVAGYNLELVDCIINGNLKCIGVNSRDGTKDAKNFILKNVEIFGMSAENNVVGTFPREFAVTMRGANCYAENCNVHDNQGHGLMIFAASSGYSSTGVFNITNCKATGNGVGTYDALGIGSYSGTNNAKCFINDCYAYNNGASGIAPHGINNVVIENCISNENREHGFVIQQSNTSIIDNCIAIDNVSFGIRIQGDFSLPAADRFVNDVSAINNKIIGNGIKVGVKAKNILCKDNIITVSSNKKPFYFDNTSDGRNNGTEGVYFINNVIKGENYFAEVIQDYFKGLVLKNNTNSIGNLIPNGFRVNSINNNTLNVYVSTDELYEPITPSNTFQEDFITMHNSVTLSDGVLTVPNAISADNFILEAVFKAKEKMTINIEFPNGTIPMIRERDSNMVLITEYRIVRTAVNNGYLNKMTITITKDNTNADSANVSYFIIALKTVQFEPLSAGTYNFKIECSEGLTLNKV